MNTFVAWFTSAIVYGTVIMYGALGEILTEKSGHLNLGVPGMMFLGGFAGFASAYLYETSAANPSPFLLVFLPLLSSFAAAALGGLLYSFLTVTLRANQNVTGLALTAFGVGVGSFGGLYVCKLAGSTSYSRAPAASALISSSINASAGADLGIFGKMFLSYGFLAYVAIILAIILQIFLRRTRTGLNLRAVGENPATADAAGINVGRYKYLSTVLGGGICGLGGMYYILEYCQGGWSTTNSIEALGWLAVALVIFATWKPANAIWGSYLFAILYWLYRFLPGIMGKNFPLYISYLIQMVPYIVTILVLIVTSFRKKRENQPPGALGLPYFREER